MMKLYWSPRTRSFTTLWLMEETGQPYERVLTDISTGAQRTPDYLAINPMGKVPALQDGDATLAEASAICAYVAERYPEAKLAPAVGDPRRARYLYWLFFAPSCIEPAIVQLATKIEMNPVAAGWVLDALLRDGGRFDVQVRVGSEEASDGVLILEVVEGEEVRVLAVETGEHADVGRGAQRIDRRTVHRDDADDVMTFELDHCVHETLPQIILLRLLNLRRVAAEFAFRSCAGS